MKPIIIAILLCMAQYSFAQTDATTVSGLVKEQKTLNLIPYANVVLKAEKDSSFIMGTLTDDNGRFSLVNVKSGSYLIEISYFGFTTKRTSLLVGHLSQFLDLGTITISENELALKEVVVSAKQDEVSGKMDKKNLQHLLEYQSVWRIRDGCHEKPTQCNDSGWQSSIAGK